MTGRRSHGRLSALNGVVHQGSIEALKRIVNAVDFKERKNEKALHKLFKACPWLINPTYFEFLTSDKSEKTMFSQLEKELKIDAHVAVTYDPSASHGSWRLPAASFRGRWGVSVPMTAPPSALETTASGRVHLFGPRVAATTLLPSADFCAAIGLPLGSPSTRQARRSPGEDASVSEALCHPERPGTNS